ncbi:MAG: HEAT repeat domain-containing protein, partial [Planctomycetota bacterium]
MNSLRIHAASVLALLLVSVTTPAAAQDDLDRQLQIVYDRLSGKSPTADWDAGDIEEAQLIAFRSLLPALSSEVAEERERSRQQFEAISLHAARPDAEAERVHWCQMMLGAQNAVIPKAARVWMLRNLAEVGGNESIERLEQLLNDRDGDVRELARLALVRIPSEGAVAVLERALGRSIENNDPEWTAAIIAGLGHRRALTSPDRLGEL